MQITASPPTDLIAFHFVCAFHTVIKHCLKNSGGFSRYLGQISMIPRKSVQASKSNGAEKRPKAKIQVKQSNSHRIKSETPRPQCTGIQWNDVKNGFRHFKIKRWNSIGSWVLFEMIALEWEERGNVVL